MKSTQRLIKFSLGFTLLEIMVVLMLLGLVMAGMGTALRNVAQAEERIDVRLNRTDEIKTALHFLKSTLGRIAQHRLNPLPNAGENRYIFHASPESVSWIGIMPARYGMGGRYFFRLMLEAQEDQSNALVLRFLPWEGQMQMPDFSNAEVKPLIQNVTGLSFQYENAYPSQAAWSPNWTIEDRLPSRIGVTIETATLALPEILIPMRVLPSGRGGSGGFAFGGSAVEEN